VGYIDGWAALNMEMPARVPRTEYVDHPELVSAVTGIRLTPNSPAVVNDAAQKAFLKAWSFSFVWSILVNDQYMKKGRTTHMGHATYVAGGGDFDTGIRCPFTDPEEVLAFDPFAEYGPIDKKAQIAAFEKDYGLRREFYSDAVNMSGVYTTLVSGLLAIFGWDMLLLAMGTDPHRFGELTRRYEKWVMPHFEALAESSVPAVMCHDDITWTAGAVFSPAWYREYVFPAYKRCWRPILDAGKRLVFTSDGNYTEFFDDLVACGAHTFVMEPCCDMEGFAKKYGRTHGFIGNADCRILLSGTRGQIRAEVERCMRIGKECPGFFMAVGNHIPANTPLENCLYYNEVYEELAKR